MRYLVFTPELREQYSHLYIALSNPEAPVQGPAELRRHAKLMDKLEAFGVEAKDVGYALPADAGTVVIPLEDAEHELAKKCAEGMRWNPGASRKVIPLFDLLENAPTADPTPKAEPAETATETAG